MYDRIFFRRQYRIFEKNIVFYNCNFSSVHFSFWYMSPSLMWYVSNTFFYVTKNSWKSIILFLAFDLYEMHDTARNMSLIFLWYFENIKIIRFKMQRHENIRCWSSRIRVTNRSHEFGKISYIIKNISKAIFLDWEIKFCDRAAIKYDHIYMFISAIWISVSDLSQSHFLL